MLNVSLRLPLSCLLLDLEFSCLAMDSTTSGDTCPCPEELLVAVNWYWLRILEPEEHQTDTLVLLMLFITGKNYVFN